MNGLSIISYAYALFMNNVYISMEKHNFHDIEFVLENAIRDFCVK